MIPLHTESVCLAVRKLIEKIMPGYRGPVRLDLALAGPPSHHVQLALDAEIFDAESPISNHVPIRVNQSPQGRRDAILGLIREAVEPIKVCEIRDGMVRLGYPSLTERTLYKYMALLQKNGLVDNTGCGYFPTDKLNGADVR